MITRPKSCVPGGGVERNFVALLDSFRQLRPTETQSATAVLADRRITVECDDPSLFVEFFQMFGGTEPGARRLEVASDLHLSVRARVHPEFGWFRVSGRDALPIDAAEFDFALTSERGHFAELAVGEPGWKCIAFRGSSIPAFAFHDRDCLFALDDRWRLCIVWYLFWRLLRSRADAIFFHASSVGISGLGAIFVGPAGGGKSTTALALAARGHEFLGDEIAGFLPESGEIMPFRRPVGIKPGPRAAAVARGLPRDCAERIEREGFHRLDIERLFAVPPPRPLPLARIVFLREFAERPSLERIVPGPSEIAELQPLMSSFLNASHSQRVFELARLLGRSKVYRLHPGGPDETAAYLEEAFGAE
jgi:hypothetical protein